ncbi:MAG TPA: hypothetical protein H9894_00110, partial [Candidatus Desulfovibrio intestinipullorum]|nr:hypothetical protein [Candidatus Desulfovibrio intestinipullorum]
ARIKLSSSNLCKDLRPDKIRTEIRISKFFFPFALQLSMNKACRRFKRRWALCPFVMRLSRTFFHFVTFCQNVVKSVKLFSVARNALIGLCFPPCQALFSTFCENFFRSQNPKGWQVLHGK